MFNFAASSINTMQSKKVLQFLVLFATTLILSSCTKDKLKEQEGNCNGDVAYSNHIKQIIDSSCAYSGCHDGGGGAPGNYTTYEKLEFFLDDLFINRTIDVRDMPPNYAVGPKSLSQEDIDLLLCWIENDFKN